MNYLKKYELWHPFSSEYNNWGEKTKQNQGNQNASICKCSISDLPCVFGDKLWHRIIDSYGGGIRWLEVGTKRALAIFFF